jgi:hypothetical protein
LLLWLGVLWQLGHGDIETTLSHYAHIVKELREPDEKIAVKTLGEMIG